MENPKRWIKQYHVENQKSGSARGGERWIFKFDSNRLYKVFQQNGLMVWPTEQRPVLLIQGSLDREGNQTYFDRKTLINQPIYGINHWVRNFGLKYQIPNNQNNWVNLKNIKAGETSLFKKAQYLLSYQFIQKSDGVDRLEWSVYNTFGNVIERGVFKNDGKNRTSIDFYHSSLKILLIKLMGKFASRYYQQASVLGSILICVDDVTTMQQISDFESFLEKHKPKVHKVSLVLVQNKNVKFMLDFEGEFTDLLKIFQNNKHIVVTGVDSYNSHFSLTFDLKQKPFGRNSENQVSLGVQARPKAQMSAQNTLVLKPLKN